MLTHNSLGRFDNQINQKLEAAIFGVLHRKANRLFIYKIKFTGCQKDKPVVANWINS
jgi:hypothetical protein